MRNPNKKHILVNVVLFPDKDMSFGGIPFGKENRIYLDGKYISGWHEDAYSDYTITLEAYCDIIEGIKSALPGLVYRDILLDEAKLTEMFGKEWKKYKENGSLWAKIEQHDELV